MCNETLCDWLECEAGELQLFPGDTHAKFITIEDTSNYGVLFKVTRSETSKCYPVGSTHFMSWEKFHAAKTGKCE